MVLEVGIQQFVELPEVVLDLLRGKPASGWQLLLWLFGLGLQLILFP